MSLDRDKAYSIDEVAEKWGCSAKTVNDHAQKAKCVLYMETDKGWDKVIVNPETAAQYHKGR